MLSLVAARGRVLTEAAALWQPPMKARIRGWMLYNVFTQNQMGLISTSLTGYVFFAISVPDLLPDFSLNLLWCISNDDKRSQNGNFNRLWFGLCTSCPFGQCFPF